MAWFDDLIGTARDRAVADRVRTAIETLLAQDAALFEVNANERSISHRLAVHLTGAFPDWDVDCEYNRDGHATKTLQYKARVVDETDMEGDPVFPDIIIHRRKSDNNLLVIEIKKTNSVVGDCQDREKLQAFCNELGYKHALFLRFVSPTTQPDVATVEWFLP